MRGFECFVNSLARGRGSRHKDVLFVLQVNQIIFVETDGAWNNSHSFTPHYSILYISLYAWLERLKKANFFKQNTVLSLCFRIVQNNVFWTNPVLVPRAPFWPRSPPPSPAASSATAAPSSGQGTSWSMWGGSGSQWRCPKKKVGMGAMKARHRVACILEHLENMHFYKKNIFAYPGTFTILRMYLFFCSDTL